MSSYWGKIPDKVVRNSRNAYTGKMTSPTMRNLTDAATGKKYQVPVDDYTFAKERSPDGSVEEYIAAAFDGSSKVEVQEVRATGGDTGHITKVEYSVRYQILRITFRQPSKNGQVVAYMRVPAAVAAELLHLAMSNNTQASPVNGVQRHVLGIRFWDLVRIRGTVNGTRYSFKYVEGGEGYMRGTATPDWGKTDIVFTRNGRSYTAKSVNQLTDNEKKEHDDRIMVIENRGDRDSPYSIDKMYAYVNRLNLDNSKRSYLLSKMDAINKGKGTEAEKSKTMYNYLYISGIL